MLGVGSLNGGVATGRKRSPGSADAKPSNPALFKNSRRVEDACLLTSLFLRIVRAFYSGIVQVAIIPKAQESTTQCGKRYFPRDIAERLAERMMRTNLTVREIEVLQMVARGLTNKEIGNALDISENTVRNHVNSIIEKLDVSDRTEAATTAIERGIIIVHN
jgi:DNA-binding NarL/FixJ family response regulator